MLTDTLTLKYLLLTAVAIWGVLLIIFTGRKYAGFVTGAIVFLVIAYFALGSGFSIRIPYTHEKMEVLVYTIHNDRVHALAHPLNEPGEPMHIVFSIDPDTKLGIRMRKSFFEAVRSRESKRYRTNIIIDMKGYMTDQGEFKHESPEPLPPKVTATPED